MDPPHGRTVVLYDPFPLWLDAVERTVKRAGLDVRACTTDHELALQLVEEHMPDLLVAEVVPGEGRTSEWIGHVVDRQPTIKTIILSSLDDAAERRSAFSAGATAYVLKTAEPEDLLLAVRQVFAHSIAFAYTIEQSGQGRPTAAAAIRDLTPREVEILQLVAEGHSNSRLARMLWVTEQTVKFHLSNIYRKLEVSNRTEASRWAQIHGVLGGRAGQEVAA